MTENVKRGRGRPRKNQNVEGINTVMKNMEIIDEGNGLGEVQAELSPVKLIYRAISKSGFDDEYGFSTKTIENYLASFYPHYKLFDTHYAGQDPNALYMFYVLVLNS